MTLLAAALFAGAASAANLVLVADGRPRSVIVIPSGRQWDKQSRTIMVEQHSGACLKGHIEQMSGARIEVIEERELGSVSVVGGLMAPEINKTGATVFIVLGEGGLAKQLGVTSDGLQPGGYRIKAVGNALALVAHPAISHPLEDGGGLRRAVVDLLEGWGCRYLWPGEDGKVVPQLATLEIGFSERSVNPPIGQRRIRWAGLSSRSEAGLQRLQLAKEDCFGARATAMKTWVGQTVPPPKYMPSADFSWMQWHGLGGDIGLAGGHNGAGLTGGWAAHGAKHPEWFALQMDGSRDQSAAGGRFRLCKSNAQLVEFVAGDIIERINNDPGILCVSLSPNDGGYSSFCLCDRCKALDPPEAPKVRMLVFDTVGKSSRKEIEAPALTDRMAHYWNGVAERVTKAHPNVLFAVDAYSYYQTPPVRERLHPSLVVRYVPSTAAEWDGWRNAGASRIYWRPNVLLSGYRTGAAIVFARRLSETFSFMVERGMLATDMDSIVDHWSTAGINYYVAARMNWDPRQKYDELLTDYCNAGFGPGGAAIRRYFTLLEEVAPGRDVVITAEHIAKFRLCLDDAQKAASENPAALKRIAFLRVGLNYTDLYWTIERMALAARDSQPVDVSQAGRLLTLNYVVMRDIARRWNLAVNVASVMWGAGDFASWEKIKGRGFRPAEAVLREMEKKGFSLNGSERDINDMLCAFGLAAGMPAGGGRVENPNTLVMEADEEGRVRELPAR